MTSYDSFFINGEWASAGSDRERLSIINPASEETIATVALAQEEDVDRAVEAAAKAFLAWASTDPMLRAQHLYAIADGIEARGDEIASLITAEVGTTTALSRAVQVGWTIQYIRDAADALAHLDFEQSYGPNAILRREPVGVVGAITPWNYPLMQTAAKIAPAIAAGCTVVLKPSEVAPLSLFVLGEIAIATGLPAGVLNIVTGTGPEAGEYLVRHPKTAAISFTGSTRAGTYIASVAAEDVKRVTLELGGKSAAIVLPGADLELAVRTTVNDCYANAGQKCVAHTRLLVHRSQLDEAERVAVATAHAQVLGDPSDPAVTIGPLVSKAQLERVRAHITRAMNSGAKLLAGGPDAPEGLSHGYFVKPTVFSSVTTDMPLAQEEVFGPVLAILPYDSVEEAVEIANNSEYGLGGGVWAESREAGIDVARRIRTGQVAVNGAIPTADLPFGGFKKSGIGREGGIHAVEEFLETKTIF